MKYMTNNLATDEKPTRPNGQSVVLLSAVGGVSLGGTMSEDGELITWVVIAAIVSSVILIVVFWPGVANSAEVDMSIIRRIESSGNPHAFNASSGARGLYQVTPILVKEFNRMNNTTYRNDDMYIPVVCEKVAFWYMQKRIPAMLKACGIKDTVENRIIAYNAGIGTLRKGIVPRETRNYINRYNRIKRGKS